jgi:hypothetical protein
MLALMEPVEQNAPARDLARGHGKVCLPDALAIMHPGATLTAHDSHPSPAA